MAPLTQSDPPTNADVDLSSDVETTPSDDIESEGESTAGKTVVVVNNIDEQQIEAFSPVITALFDNGVLRTYRWSDDTLTMIFKKNVE